MCIDSVSPSVSLLFCGHVLNPSMSLVSCFVFPSSVLCVFLKMCGGSERFQRIDKRIENKKDDEEMEFKILEELIMMYNNEIDRRMFD